MRKIIRIDEEKVRGSALLKAVWSLKEKKIRDDNDERRSPAVAVGDKRGKSVPVLLRLPL